MEKALTVMEHPEGWTAEEIRTTLDDDECMQVCREILDCKLAMQQEYAHTPNVDKEWNELRGRLHRRSRRYWLLLGTGIGMAASFLLVLAFAWMTGWGKMSQDAVVCFAAVDEPLQGVTLQTTAGVRLALNEHPDSAALNSVGASLYQSDSLRLEYDTPMEQVETHLLTTPRGQTFEVLLADGTKIWLNADSRLEYPSRFVGSERVVKLHGEAYFRVAKDEKHPFIVETDGIHTRVLGTEFNVRNYHKENSHVTLIEGSVQVCNTENQELLTLSPGENARLQSDGTFALQEVDVDTYIYWRDGYFYFDNVSFSEVMQDIGRWYNVNVVFDNQRAMEYKLHYFCKRDEGIEKAIERLQRLKKAEISLEGNTVFIQ